MWRRKKKRKRTNLWMEKMRREEKLKKELKIKFEKYYYNIFAINFNSGLLLAITIEKKSNFSSEFKLEPVTTYHIRFIVKLL